MRPEAGDPLQFDPARRQAGGEVGGRGVHRFIRTHRHERLRLGRAGRAGVVPAAVEVVDEVVEDEPFFGEVVVLVLLVRRRRGPVRRSEDRHALSVQQRELAVVDALVRGELDRHARRVQAIEVERDVVAGRVVVHPRIHDHAHRDVPVLGVDDRIGRARVGDPVHHHVDRGLLGVDVLHHPIDEVLSRREIQLGIDRKDRVSPCQRRDDVGVVGVARGVHPAVVEPRPEAVHQRRIVGVVHGFVDVVDIRRVVNECIGAEVGRAEVERVLLLEHHDLPVLDAGSDALTHRNPGVAHLGEELGLNRMLVVRSRIHQHADGDAALLRPDERARVAAVLHEPHRNVDRHVLVVDHLDQLCAAVLKRRVAQGIERGRRPDAGDRPQYKCGHAHQPNRPATEGGDNQMH